MGRRLAYMLLGMGIGLLVAFMLGAALGKPVRAWAISIAIGCGSIAVAIAERKGRVESAEEINRPVTLFPEAPADPADKKRSK